MRRPPGITEKIEEKPHPANFREITLETAILSRKCNAVILSDQGYMQLDEYI